jgi:SepF-like predicted cell division protein (DUF552 family)
MGILERLTTRTAETDVEEYLNTLGVDQDDLLEEHADMWIRNMVLEQVQDIEKVSTEIRKGNIVLLNIESMAKKNSIKLRQAVSELKGTVHTINGDIARLSEHRLIITPSGVKIAKS